MECCVRRGVSLLVLTRHVFMNDLGSYSSGPSGFVYWCLGYKIWNNQEKLRPTHKLIKCYKRAKRQRYIIYIFWSLTLLKFISYEIKLV